MKVNDINISISDFIQTNLTHHPVSHPTVPRRRASLLGSEPRPNVTQKVVPRVRRRGENYANGTFGCFNPSLAFSPSVTNLNFAMGKGRRFRPLL